MLTGRTPYGAAENTAQVMFAHCFQPPPDPREYVADIPEGCAAIVRKAMAKERENRYASADAMLADLEALLATAPAGQVRELAEWTKFIKTDRGAPATIPLPAMRPSPGPPAAPAGASWAGNPRVWAAVLAAAALAAVAGWAALRTGDQPGPAADVAKRDDAWTRPAPTDAGRADAGGKTDDGGAILVPDPETDKSKAKAAAGSFTYELYLTKAGDKKMDVVRVVREYNGFLNHVQAMDLVDRPPKKVYESTIKYEVDAVKRKFEQWGAVLEIKTKYWPGKVDPATKPAVPRLTPEEELVRIEKKIQRYADEALPTEVRNTVRELVGFAGRHLEATDEEARKIGARAKDLAAKWYAEADRIEAALPRPRVVFKEHDGGVNAVAVTRDGSLAASAGADHMVRIWRTSDGKELQVLAGHEISAVTVAFSPDDKYAASGGGDRTVRIWDYESGRQKALIEGFDHWVTGLAFSPDGKTLAGASEQRIRLFETTEWKEIAVFKGHAGDVNTIAFSPDGVDLAAGDEQGVIKIYDVKSGKVRHSLLWHTGGVRGLAYAPGGKTLVSVSWDRTIRFWNPADGSELGQIKHTESLLGVAVSPDGRTVVTSTYDGVVRFWDAQERRPLRLIRAHNYAQGPRRLLFLPDGKTLATASPDGTVKLWETGK
jgi:ribosomal protein L7/L12